MRDQTIQAWRAERDRQRAEIEVRIAGLVLDGYPPNYAKACANAGVAPAAWMRPRPLPMPTPMPSEGLDVSSRPPVVAIIAAAVAVLGVFGWGLWMAHLS